MEPLRYGLLQGGKRLRPLLVYAAGLSLKARPALLDKAAAAVECVHAYSLIHDDMPEMDNDLLRRGKPTVHARFGAGRALLTGDALQALAFEILTDDVTPMDGALTGRLCGILSRAAGWRGMCSGQMLDMEAEGRRISLKELEKLHACKTGALIRAAVGMGVSCAALGESARSQELYAAFDAYAAALGLAFQIWDDVLDESGDTKSLGKTAGSDRSRDKSTYPALLGLEEARARALSEAGRACRLLPHGADGTDPEGLRLLEELARFSVSRDH